MHRINQRNVEQIGTSIFAMHTVQVLNPAEPTDDFRNTCQGCRRPILISK